MPNWHTLQDPVDVGPAVGEDPVGGDVAGQSVCQEVPVAGQFRPRVDTAFDATCGPLGLRDVAGSDPETLHGETDDRLVIPGRLVRGKDPAKLLEDGDESIVGVLWGHSSWESAAPGTSSVMTCTYRPTSSEAAADKRITAR